jgi:hypothetical protein
VGSLQRDFQDDFSTTDLAGVEVLTDFLVVFVMPRRRGERFENW